MNRAKRCPPGGVHQFGRLQAAGLADHLSGQFHTRKENRNPQPETHPHQQFAANENEPSTSDPG